MRFAAGATCTTVSGVRYRASSFSICRAASCLPESATFLGSWPSKLKVGNGEKRGPATQREESFTSARYPAVQSEVEIELQASVYGRIYCVMP